MLKTCRTGIALVLAMLSTTAKPTEYFISSPQLGVAAVAPIVGCSDTGGPCGGPVSNTNPMPVTITGGGGGGGGPVTIADGASVNLGSQADTAWSSGNGTITAILKALAALIPAPLSANSQQVLIGAIQQWGTSAFTVTPVPTASTTTAISHGQVTALGNSLIAKASAGNLYGFYCNAIAGGAAGYCVAVNSATVPATGAITGVLDVCYFPQGAGGCSLNRPNFPANYGTGITILVTSATTPFTYTTGVDTAFISADYQ